MLTSTHKLLSLGSLFGSALICSSIGPIARVSANPTGPAPTIIAGVQWETSLTNAISRAKRERKPILHLQLFGKLNDALC
jgi:hypothetical protein